MKKQIIWSLLGLLGTCFNGISQETKTSHFSIGESLTFHSDILGEERVLNIYLPLGYSPDSSRTYPVIYLLDGSKDEDFIHIAGLVQFCSYPWIDMIPETIVVGIANVDRKRDFTFPTSIEQDKLDFPTTGHSENFIRCLDQEIIPLVEKTYLISGNRGLIGQSLGGLLATEILCTKTNLFDTYFIISPSLWWNHESLLEKASGLDLTQKTIYLAVGKEGNLMVPPAKKLFKLLSAQKTASTRLWFDYLKDKNHGDILHQAIYNGFEAIHQMNK